MTRPLDRYSDIHSHSRARELCSDTVVNLVPGEEMAPGGTYSVGIHPWDSSRPVTLTQLKSLVAMARDPRVVAIGECGFDRLRGGAPDIQRSLFDFQAKLAARLGKPLIIHCVKSDDLLLAAARRLRPAVGMWIVHGFRGKPASASALVRAGMSLSLGERFNPAAAAVVPAERLYRETDSPAGSHK